MSLPDLSSRSPAAIQVATGLTRTLVFAPGGKSLALGTVDGLVKIIPLDPPRRASAWQRSQALCYGSDFSSAAPDLPTQHRGAVSSLAFSPDGATLASASHDGTVALWNAVTDSPTGVPVDKLATIRGHSGDVSFVALTNGGRDVITAGEDGTVRRWEASGFPAELSAATRVRNGSERETPANCTAFSRDGLLLAAAGGDGVVVWEVKTGRRTWTRPSSTPTNAMSAVAFSPDATLLAMGDMHGLVEVWDVRDRRVVRTYKARKQVWCLDFSPDGRSLAAADAGRSVTVWQVTGAAQEIKWTGFVGEVMAVAFSPDGHTLAAAGGTRPQKDAIREVALFDVRMGHETYRHRVAGLGATSVTWSPGVTSPPDAGQEHRRRTLVTGDWDGGLDIWDVEHHRVIERLQGHVQGVNWVAFSPDGRTLASASGDGTVKLWSADSHQEVVTLRPEHKQVYWVAFSPTGDALSAAHSDGSVSLWTAPSLGQIQSSQRWRGPLGKRIRRAAEMEADAKR